MSLNASKYLYWKYHFVSKIVLSSDLLREKKCSIDEEKFLKFKAEGWELIKCLRSLEQFILTVKCQYMPWNRMLFQLIPVNTLEHFEDKLEKNIEIKKLREKVENIQL